MTERFEFLVRSSDGLSNYSVVISLTDSMASVACNCGAGVLGRLCKHKLRLLERDFAILASPSQGNELNELLDRMVGSRVMAEMQGYREAEFAKQESTRSFELAKKRLEIALRG